MAKVGRNEPCRCGSGKKYKKCCLNAEPGPDVDDLVAYALDAPGELLLQLATSTGVMVRRIPSASTLRTDVTLGRAAEEATNDAAALWGLPDFVFRSKPHRSGSGSREIGDGIILVGDVGVIVQVKSRETATDEENRERNWVMKHISQALRQGDGSVRTLNRCRTSLTNARSRAIEIDGKDYRWLVVVVVDHPSVPYGIVPDASMCHNPAVVMTRRDWEWLFNQLKSTHAVADYLDRVAGEMIDLNSESMRYTELALADLKAPPGPVEFEFAGEGSQHVSAPLLPLQPVAVEDRQAHLVVRTIFEDIAVTAMSPDFDEARRIQTLAELDRLPIAHRAEIGKLMLSGLQDVATTQNGATEWRLRRIVTPATLSAKTQLAFGVCSHLSEMHRDLFGAWVQLRHHELHEQLAPETRDELTTIGVLLTNRIDGLRPWDTTMFATTGDLRLDDDQLVAFRGVWSDPDASLD